MSSERENKIELVDLNVDQLYLVFNRMLLAVGSCLENLTRLPGSAKHR